MILAIMRKTIIKPALHKVTSLMEQANAENVVPKILCNTEAQTDLTQRVEQYYNDIQSSQTLTITGKIVLYGLSYMCLTNHYGLLTLGMNPEVQNERIVSPVFIASLPRTGSTKLHRTMSLDTSRFRTFDLADVIQPLMVSSSSSSSLQQPIPRWDKSARAQNANAVTQILNQIKLIYPGHMECLETLHGFLPNEADEDLGWYNNALGQPYMDSLMKLYPQYQKRHLNDTIESTHVAKYRYAWLSMIMKIYQYNDKIEWERRKHTEGRSFLREHSRPSSSSWLMKDPNHSAYLTELVSEFPDAKLIFTHRHPADVIPSLAKLFVVFTAPEVIPGTPGSSAKEWGEETLRRIKLNGIVEFTEAQNNNNGPYSFSSGNEGNNDSTFRVDLSFEEVTQDVVGAITKIYEKFYPDQSNISNTARSAFKKYLEKNERGKHGNQRRSLEDFHLTKDDVEFREYNDMFLINGPLN